MKKYFEKHSHLYIVMFISALLFIFIYGMKVLDVTYTDWLMIGGDLSQHYLGWKFFRNAEWMGQIGMMKDIAYPFSISIIYTDSIPIMAVLCKLLRNLLPQNFQYFGIWGLLCFVLQGLCAALLLQKYLRFENGTINRVQVIIGSMFFVLAPIMLRRMFWHTSLAAHWIILLSLLCYVYYDECFLKVWKCVICWGFLGVLCASIHLYYLPMCGVILLGFLMRDFDKCKKGLRLLFTLSAFLLGAWFTIWILGGFSSDMLDGAPGLGYYSFNLNSFFNPQEWSAFFPDLKNYADGQYEGFAYLGFGVFILLAITLSTFLYSTVVKKARYSIKKNHIITGAMILITILISASNELSFGKRLICSIPIPAKVESLWAIFRASGRLIWPAVYLLLLFAVCAGSKLLSQNLQLSRNRIVTLTYRSKQIVWTGILLVCLVLQVLELRQQLMNKHAEYDRHMSYQGILQDPFWDSVLLGLDLEAMIFVDKNELSQEALYAFSNYASDRKMSVNDFYFARALSYSTEKVAEDFLKHADNKTVFIFTWKNRGKCADYELHYYVVDGYVVGLKTPLSTKMEVDTTEVAEWKEAL